MSGIEWVFAGCALACLAVVLAFMAGNALGSHRAASELNSRWREASRGLIERHHEELADLHDMSRRTIDDLHEAHRKQLENIIEYGRPSGKKPAEVTNTTPPEDEVVIRQLELDALTNHLMEQGNVSKERAREEAERMLARVSGNL